MIKRDVQCTIIMAGGIMGSIEAINSPVTVVSFLSIDYSAAFFLSVCSYLSLPLSHSGP